MHVKELQHFLICVGRLMYCCISIFLGIRTGKSLRVMSSSLNTHIWEDEWKILEEVCASFEIAHWTRCKKLIFLIMFPMNLWIYSFHRANGLQSNLQAAELLLLYSPFPEAHLWFIQLGKILNLQSCPTVKWLACISILTMPSQSTDVAHRSIPPRYRWPSLRFLSFPSSWCRLKF